ncbi:hypothetical protein BKP35_17235 [Anaerobacillus arseniciselenatis]|uniref:DUF4367 domain-containing protein n=1 Tax=Anaerobacillus arseniciselenatis TaxID=85682 RepID=A0A1S2LC05_9BACI|nr:hypothetical protein [Anaerobacillus arseniciselenatis]OIJ09277.1 hypothetical protein BKP35_17235 [Anaerobacillus arseniciselenatis]
MKRNLLVLSILITILVITGCNVTQEQAIDYAKETFETGIATETKEPNRETDLFSYFLPPGLNVQEASENNLILSRGNQIYIIFSNPAEDSLSTVNYEQDREVEEKAILTETYTDEEAFSYIIVAPQEDDEYKVIVGIGGEKGTTISNKANIRSSVETIIDVIKSVTYE